MRVNGNPGLGLALCDWHSGQWDPIYMVGSSFNGNKPVPLALAKEARNSIGVLYDKMVESGRPFRREARALRRIRAALSECITTAKAEHYRQAPEVDHG